MAKVLHGDTTVVLGEASDALEAASEAAGPTGMVSAYQDKDGLWQPVAEGDVDHYRRSLGIAVVSPVYVEA